MCFYYIYFEKFKFKLLNLTSTSYFQMYNIKKLQINIVFLTNYSVPVWFSDKKTKKKVR